MMKKQRKLPRRTFLCCVGALSAIPAFAKPLSGAQQEKESAELPLQIIVLSTRAEAEVVLNQLKSGESFTKLAKERSVDPTGPGGGYIGKVKLSGLKSEIRDALEGIHPGQVTKIINTPAGFMIVKVLLEAPQPTEQFQPQGGGGGMGGGPSPGAGGGKATYTTDVSGSDESTYLYRRQNKPPDYAQSLVKVCRGRRQSIQYGIEQFGNAIQALRDQPVVNNGNRRIVAHDALGELLSYQGDMDRAAEQFQAARKVALENGVRDTALMMTEKVGIAKLRKAQTENWIKFHQPQDGIFPIEPGARWKRLEDVQQATQYFREYLRHNPTDLETKWLLNLACMCTGTYPRDIPTNLLIPLQPFESKEDIGRFVNVAPALKVDLYNMAGGVIVDDFDNDGFLDIIVSSYDACASLRYLHNNGDGTFSDFSARAGFKGQLGGLGLIQTDYNNDGNLDIFVMRGGWEEPVRNSLLRNNGDGTFTDVTAEAGLATPATSTQTAAWADFDNDGYLDVFVGNEHGGSSQLFHNNRDGTFTNIAHKAGITLAAFSKGVVAGDYDNDGYPDVYVSNLGGPNFLYHNNRDGTFTNVAKVLEVERPFESFPVWFFDFDNDGWLDIFVSSFNKSVTEVLRSYLGLPVRSEGPKLYKNVGGKFRDVTKEARLDKVMMSMGSNFGDVDNDGFLDIYLGTGGPSYAALVPNVLFRNHAGKYFVDITSSSGMGALEKGHGIAFADINNDGLVEIFSELGGATPGDRAYSALFRNPGNHGNNWISIKLQGVKTNRAAIGARIKLTLIDSDGTRRFVHRSVGSGGCFGASPLQQHVGLGKAKRIETLEIWWPTSNTRQYFHNVSPNQFILVKEFEKRFVKLTRRAFRLP